jgi:two-component system, OmpR family, sensor histidine kinase CpxA
VRRLFGTILLWFWLTLIMVATLLTLLFFRMEWARGFLLHVTLHDLLVYSVAGGIFCWFVSRHLTKPLHRLSEAAADIAEGRLSTRVDPSLIMRRDEIADLARNFDRMAERIEALITGQRRLLGDVSHELRSPLSRLMVALSLVKQGVEPTTETAENLERIGLEAHRLDALIGQLLTLTRIDSGVDRGAPAKFDFTNLIHEVANDGDFEARARGRRVSIQRADPCDFTGFEELLRSAVENVVRNAIRHTAPGTTVEISLATGNSHALLRVTDHGPGVPEPMLADIFQPFRRIPNGDSDGAGLGLAIAERAVQVHRGTIRAKNAPAGGLIVEIDLPID